MALIYPACEAGQTLVTNGVLSCVTGWAYPTAQEIITEGSLLGISMDEANALLVPFMAILASVFVARIILKILSGQFGQQR